ncbi:MAG: MarR family transcriptional regulator [Xanthomonadales bacterium]|nr:MarR family transcriptional regulator [Xanthomonadales bacterium]
MSQAILFDKVLDSVPTEAHHLRAWFALLRCFSSIERVLMQHIAQEYKSSLPRYDVLTALAMNKSGVTMGDLAVMLMVTKGNITGVVRRLEVDGLVNKVTSKKDRRIQSVTISKPGLRLWNVMDKDYDRIVSKLLAGATDAQIRNLTSALENTIRLIEKSAAD